MSQQSSDDRFKYLPFPGITKTYSGKVRDTYTVDDEILVAVASDRVSAFDQILPVPIPGKGIVLNKMTEHFYKVLPEDIPHSFIGSPHPRILLYEACTTLAVEVIVRGYLAGSLWRAYKKGERTFWGYALPDGMKENQLLPYPPMITPTTKAKEGHDENITEEEIIVQNLCTKEQWEKIKGYAMTLFGIGTAIAKKRGLILVDTKYEFGVNKNGEVLLIDEVHTPDSSRYFYCDEYQVRFDNDQPQKQLSKEFIREWLMERGFTGEKEQEIPAIPYEQVLTFRDRYMELYRVMTGETIIEEKDSDDDIVTKTMEKIAEYRNKRKS